MRGVQFLLTIVMALRLAGAVGADEGDAASGAGERPYLLRPLGLPFLPRSGEMRIVADLDGDGLDELVIDHGTTTGLRNRTVEIRRNDGRAIIASREFSCDQGPTGHTALDVNGDGLPEILFSYVVDDSLFLVVLDGRAHLVARIPVAHRGPGQSPAPPRDPAWAPGLVSRAVADCDGDGFLDIVCCGSAGYWLQPRGIWAVSWARREVIWHHATGTVAQQAVVVRMPGQAPRILVSSYAAGNGASFNGTDDSHSYLIVLSLSGDLVRRHTMAARVYTGTRVALLNGAGASPRVISVTACGDLTDPVPALISAWHGPADSVATWVEAGLTDTEVWAADLDGDGDEELLLGTRLGELAVYGPDLAVETRVPFGADRSHVAAVGDLTGDAKPEVVMEGGLGCSVVDPRKKNVAATLVGLSRASILRRGAAAPAVMAKGGDGWQQFILEQNPEWVSGRTLRATVPALIVAGVGLLLAGAALVTVRRRAPVLPPCQDHGMAFIDRRGRIAAANWTLARLLGLEGAQWQGMSLDQALKRAGLDPPITVSGLFRQAGHWATAARNGVEGHLLLCAVPVAGGLLVEAHAAPDGSSTEARLAWSTIAPRVAHDLKSPLSTLILATERAIRELHGDSARSPELLQAVLAQTDRIELLTRNFLKLAEIERIVPTPVSVEELVADSLRDLEARNPPGVKVERRIEASLPQVWVDREQVQSAVENLLENALAALGRGGTITVSAYRVSSMPGRTTPSGAVDIEIADTGEGIAHSDLPRLFDVGFTRRVGGTGLGLAIVRQVVNQHHGHIEVHSEVGIGTTVILYLPFGPPLREAHDASTAR